MHDMHATVTTPLKDRYTTVTRLLHGRYTSMFCSNAARRALYPLPDVWMAVYRALHDLSVYDAVNAAETATARVINEPATKSAQPKRPVAEGIDFEPDAATGQMRPRKVLIHKLIIRGEPDGW